MSARLSIVIPTLNERQRLPRTLASASLAANAETVVVDGGSHDGTRAVARRCGARCLASAPGRGRQMNRGVEVASGELLLFLHADTVLPDGFDTRIRETLDRPDVVAGAFRLSFGRASIGLRLIAAGANLRSRLLQLPYGDQALFLSKRTFLEIGGYPEWPILEDYDLVRRLRRRGRIASCPQGVVTSPRRFQESGPWRTTWRNQCVILGAIAGVSPAALARWSHRERGASREDGDGRSSADETAQAGR